MQHRDLVLTFSLIALVISCKACALDTPLYWDESGWVGSARWLASHNLVRALPGLRPAATFWGHPPGFHVALASLFKLFGDSPAVSHALAVGFSALGIVFTYRLGALLFDRTAGMSAALALFVTPAWFAQSAMALADLPVASMGVAAAYYALTGRRLAYFAIAAVMVLLKETAAAVVASIAAYSFLTDRRPLRDSLRTSAALASPLLVIGAFVAWQKIVTGDFFFIYEQEFEFVSTGLDVWRDKLGQILRWLFWDQYRWLPAAFVVAATLVPPPPHWRRAALLFAIVAVASCLPFVFLYYLRRYLLPAFPFFYVVTMGSLAVLCPRPALRVAAAAAIVALSAASLPDTRLRGNGEWDMSHLAVITTARAAYEHLDAVYPSARVLAGWPDTMNLRFPWVGFVRRPGNVVVHREDVGFDEFDVLLVSHPSARHVDEIAERGRRLGTLKLVKRFEGDGAVFELYAKTASPETPPNAQAQSRASR